MPNGHRDPFHIGGGYPSPLHSSDDEEVYNAKLQWHRLAKKVIKQWRYYTRWKNMNRVLVLYYRRRKLNQQIVSQIAAFAAQNARPIGPQIAAFAAQTYWSSDSESYSSSTG